MSSATTPDPPSAKDPARPGQRMAEASARVLLVHYTYTQQSLAMSDAMADGFRERGCEVTQSAIDLVDKRYAPRFSRFPMGNAFWGVLRMLPAQLLRKTGDIHVPPETRAGGYDLVCVFSPTWWLTTSMPIRSFLKAPTTRACWRVRVLRTSSSVAATAVEITALSRSWSSRRVRAVRRWHSFRVRGRPDPVADVADQLSRQRDVSRAVLRSVDSAHQPHRRST